MQIYKRYNFKGEWKELPTDEWIIHCYHFNRKITIAPTVSKEEDTSMKYGVEREGSFISKKDFIDCMNELSTTEFEDGFLLDERNWIIPTKDNTLPKPYGVEFVLAPFPIDRGTKFWNLFDDILDKHNFVRDFDKNKATCHIHIDKEKLNEEQKLNLFKVVYNESDEDKLKRYQKPESKLALWTSDGGNMQIGYYYIAANGYKDINGNQLYSQKEKIEFVGCDDLHRRIHLLNGENDNTIEFRGHNGTLKIIDAVLNVKELLEKAGYCE